MEPQFRVEVDADQFREFAEYSEDFNALSDNLWSYATDEGIHALYVQEDHDYETENAVMEADREAISEAFGINWGVMQKIEAADRNYRAVPFHRDSGLKWDQDNGLYHPTVDHATAETGQQQAYADGGQQKDRMKDVDHESPLDGVQETLERG